MKSCEMAIPSAMKYSDAKKSYLEGFKHDMDKGFYYFAKEDELK